VAAARSDQRLLVFTEQGQAVRATLSDQPISRTGPGRALLSLAGRDAIVAAFSGQDAPFYLLVSADGQVKRIPAATVANASASGTTCCRVPDGDRIVAVVAHEGDDEILIAKAGGQVLRLETGAKLRPVPTGGAGMVVGVNVGPGDRVVSAVKAQGESLLNLHASGLALAVPLGEYPVKGRGAGGVQSVLVDRPAKSPAGELALIVCQGAGGETDVFTDRGGVYHTAHRDNPEVRRATNSRPFLPLGPGEAPRGQVQWVLG
jgi:DNA gyrase/topoisomerase IV subunit A